VQADARLVEDVQHPDQTGPDLPGEPEQTNESVTVSRNFSLHQLNRTNLFLP
jgi:hypothetical protein